MYIVMQKRYHPPKAILLTILIPNMRYYMCLKLPLKYIRAIFHGADLEPS